MAVYTRQVFGMFGGNEQTVTLRFENRLLGVVLDRFGEDVPIRREVGYLPGAGEGGRQPSVPVLGVQLRRRRPHRFTRRGGGYHAGAAGQCDEAIHGNRGPVTS